MRTRTVTALAAMGCAGVAIGQTVGQSIGQDAEIVKALEVLKSDMVDAFNKRDVERLVSHLTENAVVTWQNAEVSNGPSEVRAYYNKMMKGSNPIVKSVSAAPVVEKRQVHSDWVESWGTMNDRFVLTDGRDLALNSRFSAVLTNVGGAWKVDSLHLSTNAFGGEILREAVGATARWTGLGAGGGGIAVGLLGGAMLWRRRGR